MAGVLFETNFFPAQVGGASDPNASQSFQLITFSTPGVRQLCYCSTYDSEACQKCIEFSFQVVEAA